MPGREGNQGRGQQAKRGQAQRTRQCRATLCRTAHALAWTDEVKQEVAPAPQEAEQAADALAAFRLGWVWRLTSRKLDLLCEGRKRRLRCVLLRFCDSSGTAAAPAGSLPEPGGMAAETGTRAPSRKPSPPATLCPLRPQRRHLQRPRQRAHPRPRSRRSQLRRCSSKDRQRAPATRVATVSKAPFMAPLFEVSAEAHPGGSASSRAAGAAPLTAFLTGPLASYFAAFPTRSKRERDTIARGGYRRPSGGGKKSCCCLPTAFQTCILSSRKFGLGRFSFQLLLPAYCLTSLDQGDFSPVASAQLLPFKIVSCHPTYCLENLHPGMPQV